MSHIIQLEQFEGPLDALLKIIEQQELDISEVSLAQVTDQYLTYIENSEINPTEIADFLTVAARLLLIKSKILLPFTDELEDDDIIDLEQQLKLYQKYIKASKTIQSLWNDPREMFERPKLVIKINNNFIPPKNVDVQIMQEACLRVIDKIKPIIKLPKKTMRKVVSLREKIEHLSHRLKTQAEFYFHDILEEKENSSEIIVSFLAMLELVKQRKVIVEQPESFSDIIVKRL